MFPENGQKLTLSDANGRSVRVRLEVNPRARRLILRLDETNREAVAVAPSRRELAGAAAFAAERVDWIAGRLAQMPAVTPFMEGAVIPLRGEPCRLTLGGEGRRARLIAADDGSLTLSAPGGTDTFARRVTRYLRMAALSDIGDAVTRHCETLGVDVQRISIKDTRSRWGSCTSDGKLSFSWRLVCAPPEVLDYVAAHECAHLLEMNHSDRFWRHVERLHPGWQARRDWLRRHGRELHAIGA